jgi:general secretion pathway protein G
MRKGFTLIEIMIVVIILGLLASLVVPNLIGQGEKAKQKLVCVQMKSLKNALDSFKVQYGKYPSTEEGLKALIHNPNPEKYTDYPKEGFLSNDKLPKDPWGNNYIYINNDGKIDIISLGADGKEGGSGENKDIKLSQCQR